MNITGKTCLRPFTFFELQANEAYNCCPSWINSHAIGKYDSKSSVFALWNSEMSQKIRESMFDGSFKYCNSTLCPRLQNGELDDISAILDGQFGEYLQKIFAKRLLIVDMPTVLNLCYDFSCNLRCPSCRSEMIFLKPKDPEFEKKEILQEQLLEFIHSTQKDIEVSITGSGDPFASRLFLTFIKKIDLTKNPNIKLNLQTNGVLFDPKHWEEIANVHNCKVINSIISLDASCEETYNINRVGGNWQKLLKNLEFVAELYQKKILKHVRLDMVVQENNYTEINGFIEIARKHNFNCSLQRITNWGTYNKNQFLQKNIFSIKHAKHAKFLEVMRNLPQYDKLGLGNLAEFTNPINNQGFEKKGNKLVNTLRKLTYKLNLGDFR